MSLISRSIHDVKEPTGFPVYGQPENRARAL
jgi:hypothetical protein